MTRLTAVAILLAGAISVPAAGAGARQMSSEDQRALRARLEQRFDVVRVTDGVALRPKSPMRNVRLIVVTDGTIQIDGTPVSGAELGDRVGADADAVRRLSYLDDAALRALFDDAGGRGTARTPQGGGLDPQPPLEHLMRAFSHWTAVAPVLSVESGDRPRGMTRMQLADLANYLMFFLSACGALDRLPAPSAAG